MSKLYYQSRSDRRCREFRRTGPRTTDGCRRPSTTRDRPPTSVRSRLVERSMPARSASQSAAKTFSEPESTRAPLGSMASKRPGMLRVTTGRRTSRPRRRAGSAAYGYSYETASARRGSAGPDEERLVLGGCPHLRRVPESPSLDLGVELRWRVRNEDDLVCPHVDGDVLARVPLEPWVDVAISRRPTRPTGAAGLP